MYNETLEHALSWSEISFISFYQIYSYSQHPKGLELTDFIAMKKKFHYPQKTN